MLMIWRKSISHSHSNSDFCIIVHERNSPLLIHSLSQLFFSSSLSLLHRHLWWAIYEYEHWTFVHQSMSLSLVLPWPPERMHNNYHFNFSVKTQNRIFTQLTSYDHSDESIVIISIMPLPRYDDTQHMLCIYSYNIIRKLLCTGIM